MSETTSEPESLWDTPKTGNYIGKPTRTLDQWAYLGIGPPYIKVGRNRRYRRADVDRWLAENTVHPKPAA